MNMKNDKKTTKDNKDEINRSAETQIDSERSEDNVSQDEKIRKKYTDDNDDLAEGVREMNPNRNVDKDDATNAGGYKQ